MFLRRSLQKCANLVLKRYSSSKLSFQNQSVQKYLNDLRNEFDLIKNDKFENNNRLYYLNPIMQYLDQMKKQEENIKNIDLLIENEDYEFRKLAIEEKRDYEENLREIEFHILESLLPCESNGKFPNGIVLEVKCGVGGQEAMLFTKELFNLYKNFCNFHGFNNEIASFDDSDIDGMRHASLIINDREAYSYFQYESGVHRVQRVPKTERYGRMHTSTVSVNILPQVDNNTSIVIHEKDLKWETKCSSAPGGQHVNKTESAVRLTHIPSGLVTECQTSRSQIENRKTALQKIRAQLYDIQVTNQIEQSSTIRKSQVQSSHRNEKIRTYNFPQDRITDHRAHVSAHNLKTFLEGENLFNSFVLKLDYEIRLNLLMKILEKYQ